MRVRTDQAERWRAVSLYRVMLGCCATTTTPRSRCRASVGSGPGSDDPGAGGFRDKQQIKNTGLKIRYINKKHINNRFLLELIFFPEIKVSFC